MSINQPHARPIPRSVRWDGTLAMLRNPYYFISDECRQAESDVVAGRLFLQPAIFMTGARAAALFYDNELFLRRGAAPEPLRATLFGKGGVQGLDGDLHRHRKAMFLHVLSPVGLAKLSFTAADEWERRSAGWLRDGTVALYPAAQAWLARSACAWAGIPLRDNADAALRTHQMTLLFDQAAAPWQQLRVRWARWRCESWLASIVRDARSHRLPLLPGSAAEAVAFFRDERGRYLPAPVAAVELLNLLRPLTAVSVYVAFAAHALHA